MWSPTLLQRSNFVAALLNDKLGILDEPAKNPKADTVFYTELLLARDVPETRARLEKYFTTASGSRDERLRGLLHLVMTLPEFQLT